MAPFFDTVRDIAVVVVNISQLQNIFQLHPEINNSYFSVKMFLPEISEISNLHFIN